MTKLRKMRHILFTPILSLGILFIFVGVWGADGKEEAIRWLDEG